MHILRSKLDAVFAQRLAAFLRDHGVLAGVFHGLTSMGGYEMNPSRSLVVLFDKRDHERAKLLAAEFDETPSDPLDEDDAALEADLSRLDASITIACPVCGQKAPASLDPRSCSACGAELDATALVIEQHGPEALEACYRASDESINIAEEAGMPCPHCSYWLEGLPGRGRCPECGRAYDKFEITRRFLDDLSRGRFLGEHG
ncbi:MAG: hypothetical protein GIKADHBN_01162 [Phycisphaerales bacterium]|nr:hypothetical protein [Phycisphaerales bacterium]MCK6475216.1 hypothetical protein [Phycisphaerales bacterium]